MIPPTAYKPSEDTAVWAGASVAALIDMLYDKKILTAGEVATIKTKITQLLELADESYENGEGEDTDKHKS